MRREDLDELHYIAHIENVSSICQLGILSHNRVRHIRHLSVAMEEIQERRARKVVPGGRPLHDYVNLYINARNAMLRKVRSRHRELCVLKVSPAVLDLPDVVVADQNAASDYARFYSAPDGVRYIDEDLVFARSWRHPQNIAREWQHKSIMCAEVLVPDRVSSEHILGAYVSCEEARSTLNELNLDLEVIKWQDLFFL